MAAPGGSSRAALLFAWCGAAVFLLSLLFFLYSYLVRFSRPAVGAGVVVPVLVDIALFTIFALHHSVLARPRAKAVVGRLFHPALERSLYTWTASLLFMGVCAWWRAVPGEWYRLGGGPALIGYAIQLAGMGMAVRSSARLDVLDLAGVRPLLEHRRAPKLVHVPLATTGLYGLVRHPLYLGWILLVFGAPHMTSTRLVFAVVSTTYLIVAVFFEERSLIEEFGNDYRTYRQRVRWRMVPGLF